MKIVHLLYDLCPGGAERFAIDLANEQAELGNDVILLCIRDISVDDRSYYKSDLSEKVRIISLNQRKGVGIRPIVSICKFLKIEQPTVLHSHTHIQLLYLPSLIFRELKIIWTIHSVASYYISGEIQKIIDRIFFEKKFITPVTISGICHNSFSESYGINCDYLINNGRTNIPTTEKLKEVAAEVSSLKIQNNVPVFIHVARYNPIKNQDMLIKAFQMLYKRGHTFCLILLGSHYSDQFKFEAESCPLIHVLGPKSNVSDYLVQAKYFVLSSKFEGLPLSLLEAMGKGCIPISTPAGGVCSVIRDGENGYLSQSHEIDDYVYVLEKAILEDSVTKQDVIRDYNENYTMGICASRYIRLYKKV